MSPIRVFASVSAVLITGASSSAQQTTAMVSVNALGQPGNAAAYNPSISADGRYVVFDSMATNLSLSDAIEVTVCP